MEAENTRRLQHIVIDHEKVYGEIKPLEQVFELIKDIPTETLLNYVSFFNVKIYKNDEGPIAHNIQIQLLNNLLNLLGGDVVEAIRAAFKDVIEQGNIPTFVWRYSNLLFIQQILKHQNNEAYRDLTSLDARRLLDAYLIINTETKRRLRLDEQKDKNEDGLIISPGVLDEGGNKNGIEFASQLIRGANFFKYLESTDEYESILNEYYESLHIDGYRDIFYSILNIFALIGVDGDINNRSQIVDVSELKDSINPEYLASLTANRFINEAITINEFDGLRRHMLYESKNNPYVCLVLDIGFLINQLLLSQITLLNNFMLAKGTQINFTELFYGRFLLESYLPNLMTRCFNSRVASESLDYKVEYENKLLMFELVRNPSDLYVKLNNNSCKLLNSIMNNANGKNDIEEIVSKEKGDIYPIVLFSDLPQMNSNTDIMRYESVNEVFKKVDSNNGNIKPLVFINLDFFELYEEYITKSSLGFINLIDEFLKQNNDGNAGCNSFEIFYRKFIQKKDKNSMKNPPLLLEAMQDIFQEEALIGSK